MKHSDIQQKLLREALPPLGALNVALIGEKGKNEQHEIDKYF